MQRPRNANPHRSNGPAWPSSGGKPTRNGRQRTRRGEKNETASVNAWLPCQVSQPGSQVLLIIDNCTRQCLGLPLFVVGAQVTAEMVVTALRELLPPELQFLVSDRGTHFTAHVFQELARNKGFTHVLIARHRPESNGMAERFVWTLKEWLRDKSWKDVQQLATLLAAFRAEYDDRPHQGLPDPGLSPNEYAKRQWSG